MSAGVALSILCLKILSFLFKELELAYTLKHCFRFLFHGRELVGSPCPNTRHASQVKLTRQKDGGLSMCKKMAPCSLPMKPDMLWLPFIRSFRKKQKSRLPLQTGQAALGNKSSVRAIGLRSTKLCCSDFALSAKLITFIFLAAVAMSSAVFRGRVPVVVAQCTLAVQLDDLGDVRQTAVTDHHGVFPWSCCWPSERPNESSKKSMIFEKLSISWTLRWTPTHWEKLLVQNTQQHTGICPSIIQSSLCHPSGSAAGSRTVPVTKPPSIKPLRYTTKLESLR